MEGYDVVPYPRETSLAERERKDAEKAEEIRLRAIRLGDIVVEEDTSVNTEEEKPVSKPPKATKDKKSEE